MAVQCEGLVAMCKTAGIEGPPPNENQNSQRSVWEVGVGLVEHVEIDEGGFT
jgi:hypothetical protein